MATPRKPRTARTEDPAPYKVDPSRPSPDRQGAEDATIAHALEILTGRLRARGAVMDSPQAVRDFCTLNLAALEYESFGIMFVDARHALIDFRQMFRGTLTQTSVYPREVLKEALALNAAALILTHNHPSGNPDPSRADEALTHALQAACTLVDVRILDHIIVAGGKSLSFAERGLL
jgi:DNA repair protein RadC